MRQRLPDTAPEPLVVNDIGRVVQPGEEFDCPDLVPGCDSLEPPAGEPADAGPREDKGDADAAADGGAEDTGRAPGRRTARRTEPTP